MSNIQLESIIIECPVCETVLVLPQQVNNDIPENKTQNIVFIGQVNSQNKPNNVIEKEYVNPTLLFHKRTETVNDKKERIRNIMLFSVVFIEFIALCVCIAIFS